MKKTFFLFLINLTFSASIHAQTFYHEETISETTLDEIVQRYTPETCGPSMLFKLTKAVQDCYQTTYETDPKIEQCMVLDFAVKSGINHEEQTARETGTTDIYAKIRFMQTPVAKERYIYYTNLPIFYDLNKKDKNKDGSAVYHYFNKAIGNLVDKFNKNCLK